LRVLWQGKGRMEVGVVSFERKRNPRGWHSYSHGRCPICGRRIVHVFAHRVTTLYGVFVRCPRCEAMVRVG